MVRKLGIRHLVVVNIHNDVVGMITRKNLVTLETERHSFKEVAIKQKPTFFKAKFHKTEPVGIQRYINMLQEKLGIQLGCNGYGLSIDSSGRVGLVSENDRQRLLRSDNHAGDSRTRMTTIRNRRPFGSISSESDIPDIPYIHIPYDHI